VAVVLNGSCRRCQLLYVAVVLDGNCPRQHLSGWQLSLVAIVLGSSCPGGSCLVAVVYEAIVLEPLYHESWEMTTKILSLVQAGEMGCCEEFTA